VLWGHNHSDFDPAYDAVLHAGDTITIDSKGTERQINFTYLPAGCISDFEYTGVSGGSAYSLLTDASASIASTTTPSYCKARTPYSASGNTKTGFKIQ